MGTAAGRLGRGAPSMGARWPSVPAVVLAALVVAPSGGHEESMEALSADDRTALAPFLAHVASLGWSVRPVSKGGQRGGSPAPGPSRSVSVFARPEPERLGPTAREELPSAAQATLAAHLEAEALSRPMRGQCAVWRQRAARLARRGVRSKSAGVLATLNRSTGAVIVDTMPPERVHPIGGRRWCSWSTCFDRSRPACRVPGLLRVFWYGAATDPGTGKAGALALATARRRGQACPPTPCLTDQCRWVYQACAGVAELGAGGGTGPGPERAAGFVLTSRPEAACLFVASVGSIARPPVWARRPGAELPKSETVVPASFRWAHLPHWATAGGVPGRNHVLVYPACSRHCDRVAAPAALGPTGEAMEVSASALVGLFRPGFDVVVPGKLTPAAMGLAATRGLTTRPRPLLWSFVGSVVTSQWADFRVLASEYAGSGTEPPGTASRAGTPADGPRPRAFVRAWPKGATGAEAKCMPQGMPQQSTDEYGAILRNSTFGFAPGGGGPYSYRLVEVLAAGAVPVVPEDLLLPFEDTHAASSRLRALRWESCVVRVSAREVVDLSATLVAVAPPGSPTLARRRVACARIWNSLTRGATTAAADTIPVSLGRLFWGELWARVRRAPRGGSASLRC